MEALRVKQLYDTESIFSALTYLAKDLHNQEVNTPDNLKGFAKKFSENAVVYSLSLRGEMKGICAFYCNDKITKTAFLSMIVVGKDEQGKGFGSLLIHEMIRHCKANGMNKIRLEVAYTNETACCFYIRHGFNLRELPDKSDNFLMEMDI